MKEEWYFSKQIQNTQQFKATLGFTVSLRLT